MGALRLIRGNCCLVAAEVVDDVDEDDDVCVVVVGWRACASDDVGV